LHLRGDSRTSDHGLSPPAQAVPVAAKVVSPASSGLIGLLLLGLGTSKEIFLSPGDFSYPLKDTYGAANAALEPSKDLFGFAKDLCHSS